MADDGLRVMVAEDGVEVALDDAGRRVLEVRGVELRSNAPEAPGPDVAGDARGNPGVGAPEHDFELGRPFSFFH